MCAEAEHGGRVIGVVIVGRQKYSLSPVCRRSITFCRKLFQANAYNTTAEEHASVELAVKESHNTVTDTPASCCHGCLVAPRRGGAVIARRGRVALCLLLQGQHFPPSDIAVRTIYARFILRLIRHDGKINYLVLLFSFLFLLSYCITAESDTV